MYFLKKLFLRLALKIWSGPWYPDVYCMIHSVYLARAVYVATALEIPELLEFRSRTLAELSEMTGTHQRSLGRILRLLAAYDVFAVDKQGRYSLAHRGQSLLTGAPQSSRWWVLSMGDELWASNSKVLESVRTGETAFKLAHGIPIWQWYPQNEQAHDIFIRGMNNFTHVHSTELVKAFDFSRFRKVVDVGGGGGVLIGEILRANPKLQGVLFDQPPTVSEALSRIQSSPWGDRCEAVGGSFFEQVPAGADAYIFKHVLRDWDDASVLAMLQNVHKAMADGGTLLVIDGLVNPKNGTDRLIKLLDVQIMLDGGGGLRTRAEFEEFFRQTGFELTAVHSTTIIDAFILEARKIPAHAPADRADAADRLPQTLARETVGA